jgi:uncharacterized protein YecE (DUF72 family)
MRLLTGTSGFAYREWKGSFYPEKLPVARMLGYYAERYPAVEINNSFYKLPSEALLRQWASEVPADFVFAIKAWQQITHRKRLKDVGEPLGEFLRVTGALGERLGPILIQLPPNLRRDLPRLEAALDLLPREIRVAWEFRNPSWFEEDVMDALRAHGAALCVAHGEAVDAPLIATAPWGYVRLRQVTYDDAALVDWVRRIRGEEWCEVFVFFKHEDTGTGPRLAARFAELFAGG